MDSRIKQLVYRPVANPFSTEKERDEAIKNLFQNRLGKKVLDCMMIDLGYINTHLADSAENMAFRLGVDSVFKYILAAMAADYVEEDETILDGYLDGGIDHE